MTQTRRGKRGKVGGAAATDETAGIVSPSAPSMDFLLDNVFKPRYPLTIAKFYKKEAHMDKDKIEFYDTVERIVARAWADPEYRLRLKAAPAEATAEMGLKLKEGVSLNVVEDSAYKWNLVIPHEPSVGKVEHMEVFASAGSSSCGRCRCISACCGEPG